MITKITPVEELKQIFVETLLNQTDQVTKVSEGSVLNGIAFGAAKLSQKILKDVSVIESHLFPDSAYGSYLDTIAELRGVAGRFGAIASSTFVRVVGTPGTTYIPGTHVFKGQGQDFATQVLTTIPVEGFTYVKVESLAFGEETNVDPLSITSVTPAPTGHAYCINEYGATGGRQAEDDDMFRERIKEEINVLARGTIQYLEQVLRKFNPNVLRVYNHGLDNQGELNIGVGSVNGADFSPAQLTDFRLKAEQFLNMNEFKPNGLQNYGIKFVNVVYYPIDISCRVDLEPSFSTDTIRKEAQKNLSKLIDHRFWEEGGIIQWIDLVNAIKAVRGVKRVIDNYFYPNTQFNIPRGQLPRFRGFIMMNVQGVMLENVSGTLNPFYYPSDGDFAYQATVLKSL